ncbi:MAG: hypothetical protein WD872_17600 [Pirellulaceae bacterium]
MQRKSLGWVTLFLFGLGAIVWWSGPADRSAEGFAFGCIRVGLVLGALWLALPQLTTMFAKAPRWLLGWFMGSGKSPDAPPRQPSQPGDEPKRPAPPVKRPRRRSNR